MSRLPSVFLTPSIGTTCPNSAIRAPVGKKPQHLRHDGLFFDPIEVWSKASTSTGNRGEGPPVVPPNTCPLLNDRAEVQHMDELGCCPARIDRISASNRPNSVHQLTRSSQGQ